jgi:small-conductance mechanosensitive channel
VIGVILIAVGVFLALAVVNLSGIVTTLLAGAGIIALALGFAFREIVANFIAGIYISIRQPFRKGDIIDSEDHYGTVQKIFLRCTIIRTPQGQIVYIPNSDVIGKVLINYTQNHERRIDLACRISYGDDLKKAKQIAIEAIKGLDCYNKNKPVQLVYDEFGLNAIKFKVRFWVNFKKQWDFVSARSEAIMAITQKFKEEDLKIPFPVRTLDFDVRRGEKLDAMLPNGGAKPAKIDGDSEEEV